MTKQYMLYVAGSTTSFRCCCGCNVFHRSRSRLRPHAVTYECNGCGSWYWEGTPSDDTRHPEAAPVRLGAISKKGNSQ